jgi:hypothetical protein
MVAFQKYRSERLLAGPVSFESPVGLVVFASFGQFFGTVLCVAVHARFVSLLGVGWFRIAGIAPCQDGDQHKR